VTQAAFAIQEDDRRALRLDLELDPILDLLLREVHSSGHAYATFGQRGTPARRTRRCKTIAKRYRDPSWQEGRACVNLV
jgi:hypothetical protein